MSCAGSVVERTTYVMATNVALLLLFWQWRPIGGMLWAFGDGTTAASVLRAVNLSGWALALVATFLINHFDPFGLLDEIRLAARTFIDRIDQRGKVQTASVELDAHVVDHE